MNRGGAVLKTKTRKKLTFYILLTLAALLWLVPLVMLFLSAIRSTTEFYTNLNLFTIPKVIKWSNFTDAWNTGRLGLYMKNGLIVCFLKVPLGIVCSSLLAFALTRLSIPHSRAIFIFVLVGMMLPLQSVLIPLNILFSRLNLTNTYFCLFFSYIGFGIPLGTLIFRGFFKGIPKELDEAAYIDGCGNMKLYIKVILPLAKPAIATVFIIDFLNTWNEFASPLYFLNSSEKWPMTLSVYNFFGMYFKDWNLVCADILLTSLPVILVYLLGQKYIVSGMTAGAVKG